MNIISSSIVFFLTTLPLLSSSTGQVGRTSPTSTGCGPGGCHSSTQNTATRVSIREAVNNTVTVNPGSRTTLTLIVAHATRPATGINVSAKSSEAGSANAGSLETIQGEGLRISMGELTHIEPKSLTAGETQFTFTWVAPAQTGTYFLQAIANAVNRDGSANAGDQWNWMTAVKLVVQEPNSVTEYSMRDVTVSPVPAHDQVAISIPCSDGDAFEVLILNAVGSTIRHEHVIASGASFRYVWNGENTADIPVPQGNYMLSITSNQKRYIGKAIFIR